MLCFLGTQPSRPPIRRSLQKFPKGPLTRDITLRNFGAHFESLAYSRNRCFGLGSPTSRFETVVGDFASFRGDSNAPFVNLEHLPCEIVRICGEFVLEKVAEPLQEVGNSPLRNSGWP